MQLILYSHTLSMTSTPTKLNLTVKMDGLEIFSDVPVYPTPSVNRAFRDYRQKKLGQTRTSAPITFGRYNK